MATMDPQELVPLEAGVPRPSARRQYSQLASRDCYRGPIRICRLLALLIVLPSVFIFVPLYLRYRVFSGQMYPMSMTDMRLIDGRISTTWCQRQVVKSNTTFNAFVVPGPPELTEDLVPVSMTRTLELQDDMKEYWGFYLLKGSTVTVSTCVRWPGASLIMIKGYKHLQECAYIGDDSSEELDELLEANKLGLISDQLLQEKILQLKKVDGKANDPDTMKRHKVGVSFHDPNHAANVTSPEAVPTVDVTEHDPKEFQQLLERLHALRQAAKDEIAKHYKPPDHIMAVPSMHRHRNTSVDRDEIRWISFKDIDGNLSDPAMLEHPTNKTHEKTKDNSSMEIDMIVTIHDKREAKIERNGTNAPVVTAEPAREVASVTPEHASITPEHDSYTPEHVSITPEHASITPEHASITPKEAKITTKKASITTEHPSITPEEASSREIFEDVLQRLQALGERGKRVLHRLHETMGVQYNETSPKRKEALMSSVTGSEEELDKLRKVLVEAIDEEKRRPQRQEKRRAAREEARVKRELMLGSVNLERELNEDDEERDYAAEEGLESDEYAEHHDQINETTAFDMSNSEFWSSFSSSEEALLECEGLILNLPLTPHSLCHEKASAEENFLAARANALTYRVPSNGYYFFVFNSENEVQTNFIRARFDLQKTKYDVARTKLRECRNSTTRCDLSLDIFSSQKVVLEVPLRNNDSLWNEQFVIISECEPRTSIYLVCVIAVPILIMVFAFQ